MVRSSLAVIAGLLFGSFLILLVEVTAHAIWPTPDLAPGAVASSALIVVLAAWFIGAFGGGLAASFISKRWAPTVWVVALCILLMAGFSVSTIPHSMLMALGAVIATFAGGFLAIAVTKAKYGRPQIAVSKSFP